jgi:hypothetical protein
MNMGVWTIITGLTAIVSMIAYIVTALFIRAELKAAEKDRFLVVTSELFAIWQDPEFMKAQFWLLYKMPETTWEDFVASHRGDMGEMHFHRVGSFYDRIGTLVRLKLINEEEILSTVGGYAIAAWQKMEPFVKEARRIENSVLFDDFEALLPACYECYVPALGEGGHVKPFSMDQSVPTITVKALKKKLESDNPPYLLDVRTDAHVAADRRKLPGAVVVSPGHIEERLGELPPEREIAVYCA